MYTEQHRGGRRKWGGATLKWPTHRPFTDHLMHIGFLKLQASNWRSDGCNIAGALGVKQQGMWERWLKHSTLTPMISHENNEETTINKVPKKGFIFNFVIGYKVIYGSMLRSDSSNSNLLQQCTLWLSVQGIKSCQKSKEGAQKYAFFLSNV